MDKYNGISLLDAEIIKTLRAIQNKYRIDYKRFFITLVDSYKGTKATKELKLASDTISIISSIVTQIDVLLQTPEKEESKKKSEEIFKLINEVNDNFKFFNDGEKLSNAMGERVKSAELQTGITTEEIKKTSEIIKGRARKVLVKPNVFSKLSPIASEIGKGAEPLMQLLGPFASIGKGISSSIGGMVQKERSKSVMRAREKFAGAVFPKLETGKEESVLETYKNLYTSGRGPVPNVLSSPMTSGGFNPSVKERTVEKGEFKGVQAGKIVDNNLNQSLFQFFSGPAYKAKWTSDLLEAVKPKSTSGFDRKEKSFSDTSFIGKTLGSITSWVMGLIPKIIPMIIPILGVLGAAAAGALVGKFLGEIKIGNKTVNKHIETGFTNIFEAGNKMKQAKERKGLEPVTKRALELQSKGMSVMDSIKQARSELGKDSENKSGVEKVPVVSKEGVLIEEQRKQSNEMLKHLGIISENSQKQDTTQEMQKSGKESYSLRHPLLEAMNSGLVDIR